MNYCFKNPIALILFVYKMRDSKNKFKYYVKNQRKMENFFENTKNK